MWKLTHIQATNFISFKELDIAIPQNKTTFIFGINHDNDNQKNNGTGKTTILEAIAFGITGESAKKAPSIEDLINNYEEEASVVLSFDNDYDDAKFRVERYISRDNPQQVHCYFGKDEMVQPSVLDYNRYILDVLGVTKDELYNCFILNNARFKSFFQATDKEKKEIINGFSNGQIVDEAIVKLQEDMAPVSENLKEAKDKVVSIQGSLNAIQEQLDNAEANKEDARKNREEQISELRRKIGDKRGEIQVAEERIATAKDKVKKFNELFDWVDALEVSNVNLAETYRTIREKFTQYDVSQIDNFSDIIGEKEKQLAELKDAVKQCDAKMAEHRKALKAVTETYDADTAEFKKVSKENDEQQALLDKKLIEVENEMMKIEADIEKLEDEQKKAQKDYAAIGVEISRLEAQLKGAVKCPKCGHEFLLGDESIDDVRDAIDVKKESQKKQGKAIDKADTILDKLDEDFDTNKQEHKRITEQSAFLRDKLSDVKAKLSSSKDAVAMVQDDIDSLIRKTESITHKISLLNADIDNLSEKMLDQAYTVVEGAIDSSKSYIKQQQSEIITANSVIGVYKKSIEDIENAQVDDITTNLIVSKKKYQEAFDEATAKRDEIQAEYDMLVSQQDYFVRFKSYIANKKIDSIADLTNSFLESIGSDMRIELSGYKVLKSKKVREKITMNILRDGVDGGAFEKFSQGEKDRISLAGMLAMRHLVNSNCADGKGLDLLIIDELLSGSDFSGLMSYADVINGLGITTLMITQNAVSENYPYQLVAEKQGGISTIINK